MTLGTNIDDKYAHGAGSTNIYEKNRNIAEAQIQMRNMHGSAHGAAARQAGPEVTQHS